MPALPADELDHLARIARLALMPEERARLGEDAGRILAQFEAVEAALRAELEPPAAASLVPRADEPREPEPAQVEAIVAQFPRRRDRVCLVPEGL